MPQSIYSRATGGKLARAIPQSVTSARCRSSYLCCPHTDMACRRSGKRRKSTDGTDRGRSAPSRMPAEPLPSTIALRESFEEEGGFVLVDAEESMVEWARMDASRVVGMNGWLPLLFTESWASAYFTFKLPKNSCFHSVPFVAASLVTCLIVIVWYQIFIILTTQWWLWEREREG